MIGPFAPPHASERGDQRANLATRQVERADDSSRDFSDRLAARTSPEADLAESPEMSPISAAQRFNEHGFFGKATDHSQPGAAAAPIALQDTRPGSDVVERQAEAHGVPAIAVAHGRAIAPGATAMAKTADLRSGGPDTARTPQPVAANIGRQMTVRGAQPGRGDRAAPAAPAKAPRPDAASSAISVAVHAVEQGVRVVARLGRLEPHERDRMRAEIAGLMASHGYAPREISVRAAKRPAAG